MGTASLGEKNLEGGIFKLVESQNSDGVMLYFCKKKNKIKKRGIAHLDIEAFCPELFILQLIFPLRTDSYSLKGQSVGFDLFRPPICSCSIAGQCETTEDKILEVSTVNIITLLIL